MLRRTGFKPRAMAARCPPSAPARIRGGSFAVSSGLVLAQPKTYQHRNRHLLDMARDKPCLLRVPGVCQGGTDTTVAAHSNWAMHGKAGARKADDHFSVCSCMACHSWLDQGSASLARKLAAFLAAHLQQVVEWLLISVDMALPAADRKSALWALALLEARSQSVKASNSQDVK